MKCHGLNCDSDVLIKSHIIPAGIGRFIAGDEPNLKLTPDNAGPAKQPLGEFDTQILCADCDHKLGKLDDYGLRVCQEFHKTHIKVGPHGFEMPGVATETFSKFLLAIIWRASISKRPSFSVVKLGPYEDKARDVLFEKKPLSDFKEFQIMLQRYVAPDLKPELMYFHPVAQKFAGLRSYGMGLAGFRFVAKFSTQRFAKQFAPYVINEQTVLRGTFIDFRSTGEYESVIELLQSRKPVRRTKQ